MSQLVAVLVLAALVALAWWGMRSGWERRRRRTADVVPVLPGVPAELGERRGEPVEATYVSSTRGGDWLDRVVAHDLGTRSAATVEVFDAGVRIARTGSTDLFLPAERLRAVGTAPGMAGKYLGRDGLVVLTWQPDPDDPRGLDTGLHPRHADDRTRLVDAVHALIPPTEETP